MLRSLKRLVGSPACIPQWTLEQILAAYRQLGLDKFEVFTGWVKSNFNLGQDPAAYRDAGARHGFLFTSMHLPPVTDDFETSLRAAVEAAKAAEALGAAVVLFKANSRPNYICAAKPFLDALERENVRVTPVLQNHKGSPLSTLEEFREVMLGIDDPRMKTLLEVGHFQRVGVSWREGYELLNGSIALVHINEIDTDGRSVPFGSGVIDFPGLFRQLARDGYAGHLVLELELSTRESDPELTLRCLGDGIRYLESCGLGDLI